jgi:hypothetical protein
MTVAASQGCALSAALSLVSCGVGIAQPISAASPAVADAQALETQGDAAPDPLAEGLVAYWKLDETDASDVVIDSSGRGHSGVSVNGPLPSSPPVQFRDGGSRSFDGVSQYIVVANSPDMNFSGEVTLAAWVNIAATTVGCHYFVAHGYCWTPPGEVALRLGAPGCGPGTEDHYWAAGSWLSAEHSAIAPLYDLDYNVWIHIAGVYDGQTWHLYRNGEEIATQTSTVGAVPVDADWSIGARATAPAPCMPTPAERYFDGLIAEVRVYNRALGPSEILELYQR